MPRGIIYQLLSYNSSYLAAWSGDSLLNYSKPLKEEEEAELTSAQVYWQQVDKKVRSIKRSARKTTALNSLSARLSKGRAHKS